MNNNLQHIFEEYGSTEIIKLSRLDELTIKDIKNVIDPNDLPHKDYEPLLKDVIWQGAKNDICKWLVMNNMNGWNVYLRFVSWNEQLYDTSTNARDVSNLLMWSSDVQMYCACPSYTYHGYRFVDFALGCGLVPETRFPKVRNPRLLGIGCKHIRRLYRVIEFQRGFIAGAIKKQRASLGITYSKK